MPKSRTHINLPVSDLQSSIAFYSKVFNTEPSKLKTDYANFRLDEPALHLALVHQANAMKKEVQNGNGQHFGIELFDDADLEAWKEKLKTVGILPHLEEENVTCCYAVANKFWLHDPDGNEWEFWVRQDDEGDTLFSSSESTSCCAPMVATEAAGNCCG